MAFKRIPYQLFMQKLYTSIIVETVNFKDGCGDDGKWMEKQTNIAEWSFDTCS
jgi:hypothetical protein